MKIAIPIVGSPAIHAIPGYLERITICISNFGYDAILVDFLTLSAIEKEKLTRFFVPWILHISSEEEGMTRVVLYELNRLYPKARIIKVSRFDALSYLIEKESELSLYRKQEAPIELRKAIKFIYQRLESAALEVEAIADSCFVSRDKLERLFKKYFNMSVWQFVINSRIQVASLLVSTTSLSIGEIALCVGYEEITSFCRAFKKVCGVNATALR